MPFSKGYAIFVALGEDQLRISFKLIFTSLVTLLFSMATIQCVTPEPVFKQTYTPSPNAITIMTYNVENLFDTEDDAGKKDEAYLPLAKKSEAVRARCRLDNNVPFRLEECLNTDWSEAKLDLKLKRLTDVITKVRNGRGPDVLILQEVENRNVLEIWRTKYLAPLGYKPAVLVEGPDERGIDVGIISRLDIVPPLNLHKLQFVANDELPATEISETRGILEATIKLPDATLMTVMAVHLPSQSNPAEMRNQALDQLLKIKNSLPKDRLVVVGGDFNISSDEDVKMGFINTKLASQWNVSHIIGCKDCKGTYYYRKNDSWSFFDLLLTSQNMMPGNTGKWKVVPESVRIENSSLYQNNRFGNPGRFDSDRKDGVSDHWPLALEIINDQQPNTKL